MTKSKEELRQEMMRWGELKLNNQVARGLLAQDVLNEKTRQIRLGQSGLSLNEFTVLHADPNCQVVEQYIGREPSGFWSTTLDGEASASVYALKCLVHKVLSETWWKHIG